jgi:hypothetical protein
LYTDDSIDLCNYFNDSQNSRSTICNGSIEFIDDQFSPHNSSPCSSSNAEDSLNCTVKNERNLNVLSLNCCGAKVIQSFLYTLLLLMTVKSSSTKERV